MEANGDDMKQVMKDAEARECSGDDSFNVLCWRLSLGGSINNKRSSRFNKGVMYGRQNKRVSNSA